LLTAARLAQANLFSFHFTCIPRHQSGTAQHRFKRGVKINQRTGNTVAHRPGLPGFAAPMDVDHDIKACKIPG
jgi:hypothetical protein